MSKKAIIRDPVSGEEVKKPIKPFMVDVSVAVVEQGEQILPRFEDDPKAQGLVDQMRAFCIERMTRDGKPVYSQGYDHTLTAWMLTIMMFRLKETELGKFHGNAQVAFIGKKEEQKDDEQQERESRPRKVPLYNKPQSVVARAQFRDGMSLRSVKKALQPRGRTTF